MNSKYPTAVFRYVLKAFRLEKRLTQEQLSERVGVCHSFIGQLETGRKLPSLEMLFRIAEVLEIPASELVRELERQWKKTHP